MSRPDRILLIEDVPTDAELVELELRRAGLVFAVRRVEAREELAAALDEFRPDLIISDFSLPAFDGMEALALASAWDASVPFILVTGSMNEETAVDCMKAGAWDYVLKDRLSRLPLAVRAALERSEAQAERRRAQAELEQQRAELVASENQLRAMFELASIGLAQADPRTARWLRVNRKLCEITGYDAAEMLALHVPDITHPDDRQADWELFQRVVRGEAPDYRLEKRYIRKDGTPTWVNVNMTVIRDAAGEVVRTMAAIEDISERKRAEEALRASEARFQLLARVAPVGIFQTDERGATTYVNQRWSEIAGLAAEVALGGAWLDAVHPDDRQRLAEGWDEATRAGRPSRADYRFVRADGTVAWVVGHAVAVLDAEGRISGYVGTITDITERKRAEEALRKSEARFRTLYENSTVGLYRTSPAGRIIMANPTLVSMLGYAAFEELADRDLEKDGFHPSHPRRQFLDAIEREGEVRGWEAAWYRADGSQIFVRESARAVRDAEGRLLYLDGSVEDVTERKRAEEALIASEARYRRLFEAAKDGILILDAETGAVIDVNPFLIELLGCPYAEFVGRRVWELGFFADLAANQAKFEELRRDEYVRYDDLPLETRDGRQIHVEFVSNIYPVDHRKVIQCDIRDISERKRLGEQLRQSQKMEAIGRLAGGIAHDFNNLLQAMMSQVEVLRRSLPSGADGPHASLGEVDQLVRRGAALTRQLLLFSRKETTVPEPLDLSDVIRNAANMLRRIVRENVSISMRLADRRLPVRADRGQLDQVLMNLVVNASDAMAGGGSITLETGGDDAWVWLAVGDTGSGIDEAIRAQIFDPFFTTKEAGKGTGLGLSVVHGIVAAHGGRVEVESRRGEGTTVTVRLPREGSGEVAPVEFEPDTTGLDAGHGERILVVEDEEGARTGLEAILGMLGYAVTALGSGEEAGLLPAEPAYDLLLTDLMLPGVSGEALAAGLKERWPELRVILMSGYTEDEAVRRGAATATVSFLQKPFDIQTLAGTLRRVLAGPR